LDIHSSSVHCSTELSGTGTMQKWTVSNETELNSDAREILERLWAMKTFSRFQRHMFCELAKPNAPSLFSMCAAVIEDNLFVSNDIVDMCRRLQQLPLPQLITDDLVESAINCEMLRLANQNQADNYRVLLEYLYNTRFEIY